MSVLVPDCTCLSRRQARARLRVQLTFGLASRARMGRPFGMGTRIWFDSARRGAPLVRIALSSVCELSASSNGAHFAAIAQFCSAVLFCANSSVAKEERRPIGERYYEAGVGARRNGESLVVFYLVVLGGRVCKAAHRERVSRPSARVDCVCARRPQKVVLVAARKHQRALAGLTSLAGF